MKKLTLLLTALFVVSIINAQSLEEIVKNYSAAMKSDKLASVKTIKITGKMSAMGMEIPVTMLMKNPNKIKVTYSISGQEMVSVFDGEKGYSISPLTGSSAPVEITGDQLESVKKNSPFNNELLSYFKSGKLTLEGEENVNNKPAFKLKAAVGASPVTMYIDKSTYQLVKTSSTASQMGQSMNVDSFMSDYFETDGVVLPKKTTAMTNGMEAGVITFDKVEVNIPVDDSVFKVK